MRKTCFSDTIKCEMSMARGENRKERNSTCFLLITSYIILDIFQHMQYLFMTKGKTNSTYTVLLLHFKL